MNIKLGEKGGKKEEKKKVIARMLSFLQKTEEIAPLWCGTNHDKLSQ